MSSVTLTVPATKQTGDVLVAHVVTDGTSTISAPAGWTLAAGTTLTGGGDVNAPIVSTSTTARIESLGNLALGNGSTDGFDFAGTLLVSAGDNVTLRDANLARLGILTSIAGTPTPGMITAPGGVEVGAGAIHDHAGGAFGERVVTRRQHPVVVEVHAVR